MADAVSVQDQWASAGDGQMAAVFGTLVNGGTAEARIVSGSSPAAGMVEVHEVSGPTGGKTMRAKDGGLVLPPGFHATVVADGLAGARHMAIASNGDIYVSTRHGKEA